MKRNSPLPPAAGTHRGLFLVKSAPKKPPKALVEEALKSWVLGSVREYADALAMTRAFYKAYPEQVLSDVWEPHIVAAFRRESHYHPRKEMVPEIPDVKKLRRELRGRAEQTATRWMQSEAEREAAAERGFRLAK